MPGSDFRGATWPQLEYDGIDPTTLFAGGSVGDGQPDDAADNDLDYTPEAIGTSSIWSEEQKSAYFYNSYDIVVDTDFDSGLRGAPKAGARDTGAMAVWRAHGGAAILTVTWVAERFGEQPILPHWEIDDPLYVLLRARITPNSPPPMPDGLFMMWRVQGVYTYLVQKAPTDAYYFPVATTRVTTVPASQICLGPAVFSKELLRFLANPSPPKVTF